MCHYTYHLVDSQDKHCKFYGKLTMLLITFFNLLILVQLSLLPSGQSWDDLSLSDHEDEISYQVKKIEDASSLEAPTSFLCISCGLEGKELPFFPEKSKNDSTFRQFVLKLADSAAKEKWQRELNFQKCRMVIVF